MSDKEHTFVITWDCNGLEFIADVTQIEQEKVWAKLTNQEEANHLPNLMHLQLRARFNSHRHYEIYIFTAVAGIHKDDIIKMFEQNPQSAADTIRKIGHCHYSDRATITAKIV